MPSAHLEWLCPHAGVVRVYADGNSYERQDPYEWAATVERLANGGVELKGVCKRLSLDGRRAIEKVMLEQGITHAQIQRHGRTWTITPRANRDQ